MDPLYLILGLVILIGIIILLSPCEKKKDHFFNDHAAVIISWAPSPSPNQVIYNWRVCNAASCPTDPTMWSSPIQVTAVPNVVLNNATCPGCDFGQTIVLAVQAQDTMTQVTSTWATYTVDLSIGTTAGASLSNVDQARSPLVAGDSQLMFLTTVTAPSGVNMNLELTVVRGTQTFVSYTPLYGTHPGTVVDATDPTMWENSDVPEALAGGDIVTAVAAIYGGQNILYYTSPPITVQIATVMAPPSSFTYTVGPQ